MQSFNRNFLLMIIGQIISLFGNAILRFALSLYVLEVTGSASIFATITAISIIPTILFSPIGGIIADRFSRKIIMLSLDFLTALLIMVFTWLIPHDSSVILIALLLIALSMIQAFYQPSVSASIPLLVKEEQLIQANSIVSQVNALASLLGPIFGGFLYSFIPFVLLLSIAAAAFFISALLECIMQIPYQRSTSGGFAVSTVTKDIKESIHFLRYDQPSLISLLALLAIFNMVYTSFLTIGLPVISNITLGLSSSYYGWLQAAAGIGSIIGGFVVPLISKRIDIRGTWYFLLGGSIVLLPIALTLFLHVSVYLIYICTFVSCVLSLFFTTLFDIYAQTFLQQSTPSHLLGKVASFVTVICMCSKPIGQAAYGFLLDLFAQHIDLLILICALLSILIALFCKQAMQSLNVDNQASQKSIKKAQYS